jgi:hypothetical protein
MLLDKDVQVDSAKAIAIALRQLLAQFERPPYWDDDLTPVGYFSGLDDLRPDLLATAIERCIKHCRFFPKVAEIRDQVRNELDARDATYERERVLRLPAPRDECEPWTPKRLAEHEAKMAAYWREFDAATARVVRATAPPYPRQRSRDEGRPAYDPEQQRHQPLAQLHGLDEFRRRMANGKDDEAA